jgi:hypothetical protein
MRPRSFKTAILKRRLKGFVLKGWDGVGVFDGSGYRR